VNPESLSELVHSDVKVASFHLSRSDKGNSKGNSKSQASNHELWLQPIELLDEARRHYDISKSHQGSCNSSMEKSDVHQDLQAENAISSQL
jgi:hypothetical protein